MKMQMSLETKILLDTLGGFKIEDKGFVDVLGMQLHRTQSFFFNFPFFDYSVDTVPVSPYSYLRGGGY